ncbi:hypothetical protein [Hirschia litorea]|uniref:ApeI dehydratase-like domain-containing protein n=1 Tax=Hirschia litorea TaxID=1199156 RepID=A0ABW2INV5_9PROT
MTSISLKPKALKNVIRSIPLDHPCLEGHFPNAPIIPAALTNECVHEELRACFDDTRISGVSKLKFIAPLLPDMEFEIQIYANKNGSVPVSIRQGDKLCFSGLFHLL